MHKDQVLCGSLDLHWIFDRKNRINALFVCINTLINNYLFIINIFVTCHLFVKICSVHSILLLVAVTETIFVHLDFLAYSVSICLYGQHTYRNSVVHRTHTG